MKTKDFIKMQSINFYYMNFMLQVSNSDSIEIETESIKKIFMDGDTICALMQNGEVIYTIDLDPEISTEAIRKWIDNNPSLHKKVLALMENQ